jgi:RHS repeat-associated protein
LPFGEALSTTGSLPVQRFTGQDRDDESGLDNFNARAFDPGAGRFTRLDPAGGDAKLPQTWNRYAYARNDPLGFNDPSGMTETRVRTTPLPDWVREGMIFGGGAYYGTQYATRIGGPPGDLASNGSVTAGYTGGGELNAALGAYEDKIAAAVSSISVLGKLVAVNYAAKTSLDGMAEAGRKLSAAATLINDNAKKLNESDRSAIGQVSGVYVSDRTGNNLGWLGAGSISLTAQYIRGESVAWVASTLGHEGQHGLNAQIGIYLGGDMWKNERSASATQLHIGRSLGLSPAEVNRLNDWMANPGAMQQHMETGYRQP